MEKSFSRYSKKFIKYKLLFTFLLALSSGCFLISFLLPTGWNDLFINLSATFLGLIFAIFIVDEILQKKHEEEYKEAYINAKSELVSLANKVITYFREPFGYRFPIEKLGARESDWEDLGSKINRSLIPEVKAGLKIQMKQARAEDWKRLIMNIFLLRQQFVQLVPIYKDSIPPSILGKLLSLKRAFEAFDLSVGLFADLFINEPANWPKNKQGHAKNIQIRNGQLLILEDSLKDIFDKCDLLMEELDKWDTKFT